MSKQNLTLSVVMITYGHQDYIKKAIESIVMQTTDFEIEFIIANDNSPDQTDAIIQQILSQHKNADWIKYTNHKENKGVVANFEWALFQAQGKYIALCEGDDYWTDPLKLQKQVDFLEAHPEYSLSVGGFKKYDVYTKETEDIIKMVPGVIKNKNGYTFELDHTSRGWITKTLTAVFRNDKDVLSHLLNYRYSRDVHLFYHLLKKGKGFYFTEIFGVYTIHTGGVFSMQPMLIKKVAGYNIYKELHLKNKDEFSRKMRFMGTLALFRALIKKNNKKSKHSPLKLYVEAILLFRHLKEIKYLIAAIIK